MTCNRMTYSTRHRPQASPLAQRFPAFQIDASDVEAGAVRVLAKAPSGAKRQLEVQIDNCGQFTTNFVPNEIGDWLISILYREKNIQGSPFFVRVYDPGQVKVFGLEGGCMGSPVKFSVDTSSAGEGKLKVEVRYKDRVVPCQITPAGNRFNVCFMPEGSGTYRIHVVFANMEVSGSPFTVEIASPTVVTVSGEGITAVKVGLKTFFLVNTGQEGTMRDVVAKITSPGGAGVPCNILDNGGGVYRVDYQANEIGTYMIDVFYQGKIVAGSPFRCQAFDHSRIVLKNLPEIGFVGRLVQFDIDTEDCGNGKMKLLVNDGAVPITIDKRDPKLYTASFMPTSPGPHIIRLLFNEQEVSGSPWKVDVRCADHVTTTAGGLGMVLVGKPTFFEVSTIPIDGKIDIHILSPSRQVVPSTISKLKNCVYRVDFIPPEPGPYQIEVMYEDLAIPGNPFSCIAYDCNAVRISAIRSVTLGKPVDFSVDASCAGMGDLEIKVNRGTVPVSAQLISSGIYGVSFVPKTAGKYMIEVAFNGCALRESPIYVTVIDVRQVTISGGGCHSTPVGRPFCLTVNTESAGDAELVAKITGPGCRSVTPTMSGSCAIGYNVQFTPFDVGVYQVEFTYGGEPVPHCPVIVNAYDASKIKVLGVKDGLCGQRSEFIVDMNDCGEGEMEVVIISANGRPILNNASPMGPGRLEVSYVPVEGGTHMIQVTFNKDSVPGNPFKFFVRDPCKATAKGDGLIEVQCGQVANFLINAPNATLSDIDVEIIGPNCREVMASVNERSAGNFKVDYTPTISGIYQVNLKYFGQPICGSPFQVKAWDPSKVYVSNIRQGCVGVESVFNIELREAGDGTLEITVTDPHGQLIPNHVATQAPGHLQVHVQPQMRGLHQVMVTMNGQRTQGCPFSFNVIDSSKVSVKGEGLGLVPCRVPTSVIISCPDSKLKDYDVKVTGPDGSELLTSLTEVNSSTCRLEYTPTVVGTYNIEISYGCQTVPGSPFVAKAWDATQVVVADAGMGVAGCMSSFKVLVADAGEGVVEISITDPNGRLVPNQAESISPGCLDVTFVPTVAGTYRGNVTFNKEKVPGSPFTFLVIDPSKVTVRGDGLGFVPVRKQTSFNIYAPYASSQNLEVSIIGPNCCEVPFNITENANGNFKVDYTPIMAGDYQILVKYFCNPVPVCPAVAKAWDISKVCVAGIDLGRVGHESNFTVDVKDCGEGSLEISIQAPNGQMIENSVAAYGKVPGVFQVSCVPFMPGPHRASILFNSCNATGSPFVFMVCDPSQATASGEGLQIVRCNRPTSFTINGPAACSRDVHVKITGPCGKEIRPKVRDLSPGVFGVEYIPAIPGDYLIEVKYFDEPIRDSPFMAVAWDSSLVSVCDIRPGIVGRPSFFHVDASRAGPGNLDITVVSKGESIPVSAQGLQGNECLEVTYIPINISPHLINIRFNGELIPGSPFSVSMLDGSLAVASGPGLGCVKANVPARFDVNARAVGCEADLDVVITSPRCLQVPAVITGTYCNGYQVEYVPVEAGQHTIVIKYAEMAIKDSPFHPEVYDCSQVQCSQIPFGIVGKPVTFKVDASMAGCGRVTVSVQGKQTRPQVEISTDAPNLYSVTFIPTEGGVHNVSVKFNDCEVCGSPFVCNVVDQKNLRVRWDSCVLRPVGCPVNIELDTTTSPALEAACSVLDPYRMQVGTMEGRNGSVIAYQFIPEYVGPYVISLEYGNEPVPGSPFVCNVYDAKKVKIVDATTSGNIGQEASFTVDTSEAGTGTLDVTISCAGGTVPMRQECRDNLHTYYFVPRSPVDHTITIAFNKECIPDSPLVWTIVNPAGQMCLSNGCPGQCIGVGQPFWGVINNPGFPINLNDIKATATAPTGDLLPVRVTQQPDNSIRLEFTSMVAGTHSLKAEYAGQLIPGSPLVLEIFDASKIRIEGSKCGEVNVPMVLDVIRRDAGNAELNIIVTDPCGEGVPFDVEQVPTGEKVTYVPAIPGIYRIHMTYGCLDVPGCPIRQEIRAIIPATACGDGLIKGIANQVQSFIVDPHGQKGELVVHVEGPTTSARVQIEPAEGGRFKVNYLPCEAGIYNVSMLFNGRDVEGCSFHPRICDPSQIEVIDDISQWTDPDHVIVKLNEMKTLRFDVCRAGPGELTVKIEGPDGNIIPADVVQVGMDGYAVKFVPKKEGDYFIRSWWCGVPIVKFPIIATVEPPPKPPHPDPAVLIIETTDIVQPCPAPAPPPPPAPPVVTVDITQIVLTGPGLCAARCLEPAQFLLDAANAGPGTPSAKLIGLKGDVVVDIVPLENRLFACSYLAILPGAYLLTVMWSDQQVPGSPFKVSVLPSGDASRVVCIGDGLTCGILGREINAVIDTRKAGLGEVTAQCQGPTKAAVCELDDRRDGTFELIIRPQEAGIHILQIKFNCEHVPGSPFTLKVCTPPDASKVRACGSGLKSGILATFESQFLVDTTGAGPGQLNVKVRGKKGTFRVEMKRHDQKERTIVCRYNPTEIGEYFINVQWAGEHIPGSPFHVVLVDTIQEFRKLQAGISTNPFGKSKFGTLTSDMNDGFTFMDG